MEIGVNNKTASIFNIHMILDGVVDDMSSRIYSHNSAKICFDENPNQKNDADLLVGNLCKVQKSPP